jgi:hypothetical protein
MSEDLFKGVEQKEFELSNHQKLVLPLFYFDNTSLIATFTASTNKVQNFLPHPEMRPAPRCDRRHAGEIWANTCTTN